MFLIQKLFIMSQSDFKSYMEGKQKEEIIDLISGNNSNEELILIFSGVGWVLRFIPLVSVAGWANIAVTDILQFISGGNRGTIYNFLLDRVNYPDDAAYATKMEEYIRDLDQTRDYDISFGAAMCIFNENAWYVVFNVLNVWLIPGQFAIMWFVWPW